MAHLDLSLLKEAVGDDPQELAMFVETFLEEGESLIAQIQTSLAESPDCTLIQRLAHSMKGMSGHMGATDLQQAAYDLEHAAKATQSETFGALFMVVQAQFSDASQALKGMFS